MLAKLQQLKLLQSMITNYFFNCSRPCTKNCMDVKIPLLMLCKIFHATLMQFLDMEFQKMKLILNKLWIFHIFGKCNVAWSWNTFFLVHLGINYFRSLCVSVGSMKIVAFPHIWGAIGRNRKPFALVVVAKR
jgi:hypothetical protein